MIRAISVNGLMPVIDRNFGLAQVAAAFDYYRAKSRVGKVCLEI